MVISNNTIAASGNDPYEDYENAAIFVSGLNLGSATTGSGDTIPAGNYFISGITISDNTINTDGHGIRLQDARNSTITGNTITYSQVSKPKIPSMAYSYANPLPMESLTIIQSISPFPAYIYLKNPLQNPFQGIQ